MVDGDDLTRRVIKSPLNQSKAIGRGVGRLQIGMGTDMRLQQYFWARLQVDAPEIFRGLMDVYRAQVDRWGEEHAFTVPREDIWYRRERWGTPRDEVSSAIGEWQAAQGLNSHWIFTQAYLFLRRDGAQLRTAVPTTDLNAYSPMVSMPEEWFCEPFVFEHRAYNPVIDDRADYIAAAKLAFKAALREYCDLSESRGLAEHAFEMKADSRKLDRHVGWLIEYQVSRLGWSEIAERAGVDVAAVQRAVEKLAAALDLQLRRGRPGRPRGRENRLGHGIGRSGFKRKL